MTNPDFADGLLGDAQAVLGAGILASEPTVTDDRFLTYVVPAGAAVKTVDLEEARDLYRDRPRYKKGTATAHDAASFIAYMGKHGLDESEVWADAKRSILVGVINAHQGGEVDAATPLTAVEADQGAGRGDHRVQYSVMLTDAWQAWVSQDGKLLDQTTFAELIEDRAVDIVRPSAADMLEMAESFHASGKASFESTKLLSSGQRQFEFKETIESKAGRRGQLEIPKDFDLALVPFEGASAYKMTARFRYRINDGVLRVGYRLNRPADVLREAFLDVVNTVAEGVEAPVFRGVSP